ncbi:hypothetical protein C8R47DRAFT_1221872 [Mycena vitilis]|nr:hypothetical protein C8R47DRAFT_1221872 [Mycena vitilis]
MPQIQNARVLFNSVPKGFPVPGETTVYDKSQTIDLETVPLNGGFLIKTLVLSIDPYFRVLMQEKGHPAAFPLGAPLSGFGVAVVLRSENPAVSVGKHVYGFSIPHQEYSVLPALGMLQVMERHPNVPWSAYLGPAGLPGQTAYIGWKEFAQAKKGEVVFVSSGASSVGSMVIQLAKQGGLKVIASAGSEEKIAFVKSLGADVVFNYKTTDTREILEREGPIDIYWDNVGGDVRDAAFEFAAPNGRFLLCGSISEYNTEYYAPKGFHHIGAKGLHVHGVIMAHLPLAKYLPEFYATVPAQLASGDIKYTEDITKGLEKVGDVILAVQNGTSKAKAVVLVAEEDA